MSVQLEAIQKSISSLTDEELIERVKSLRSRRDNPPMKTSRAKTKRAKPLGIADAISAMSDADKKALFLKLTGGSK